MAPPGGLLLRPTRDRSSGESGWRQYKVRSVKYKAPGRSGWWAGIAPLRPAGTTATSGAMARPPRTGYAASPRCLPIARASGAAAQMFCARGTRLPLWGHRQQRRRNTSFRGAVPVIFGDPVADPAVQMMPTSSGRGQRRRGGAASADTGQAKRCRPPTASAPLLKFSIRSISF